MARTKWDAPECNRGRYMADPEHGRNCPACKAACARYNAEWKERNRSRPVPEHLHGRPTTKQNYGCPCEPCEIADRERRKASRQATRKRRKVTVSRAQRAA